MSVRTPLAVAFAGSVTADDGDVLVAGSYGDVEREYLALRREVAVVEWLHLHLLGDRLAGRQPERRAAQEVSQGEVGVVPGGALQGRQRGGQARVDGPARLRGGAVQVEEERPGRVPARAERLETTEVVACTSAFT